MTYYNSLKVLKADFQKNISSFYDPCTFSQISDLLVLKMSEIERE